MSIYWKKACSENCIRGICSECNVDIGDENVCNIIQSDLLSRIIWSLIRGSISSAVLNRRKIISDRDLSFGSSCSYFPSSKCEKKYMIIAPFTQIVNDHLNFYLSMLEKVYNIPIEVRPRFSGESLLKLQSEVENRLKGFIIFVKSSTLSNKIMIKHVEIATARIFGDESYIQHFEQYCPCQS